MQITIPAPVDMHVHFRQGKMLESVLPYHDKYFDYALVMPNTLPPILRADDVVRYKGEISGKCKRLKPLMTIKLAQSVYSQEIEQAHKVGAVAAKLYPEGVTTNSQDGITKDTLILQPKWFCNLLDTMSSLGMILCVHGEMPGEFSLDREKSFLYPLRDIMKKFPKLKIVMEHITTRDAVMFVCDYEQVAATITLHHLFNTLDDVIGDKLNPHNFCKPIPKRPQDQKALLEIIQKQHPRVFFGSDSATHYFGQKECANGCAGCFTSPVLLGGLAHVLQKNETKNLGAVLKTFLSDNAREVYRLDAPGYELNLIQKQWTVPEKIDDIIPFKAGEILNWQVGE